MLAEITGGLALANTAYQFVGWVKGIAGSKVISASFRYDGTRIEGSDKIEVEVHPSSDATRMVTASEVRELQEAALRDAGRQ